MQAYFAMQIGLWTVFNPASTAFQRAERWRLCSWHWSCPIQAQWVSYDKISANLKRAVLVGEDDIFFQHKGVRVEDMQKAWEKNQQQVGKFDGRSKLALRGGSTITQQLAKNLFLWPEKSFVRKGEEALITLMIETTWSKRRILEVYMNEIEWGNGIFGAEAASRHYFGISANELNEYQAAMLASMVPSPQYYDRKGETEGLARQTEVILERMNKVAIPPSSGTHR